MTDEEAKAAFWAAVHDPDASSLEIAQDIALERGWKLWQLGEEFANKLDTPMHFEADNTTQSLGAFYVKRGVGVEWVIDDNSTYKGTSYGTLTVAMYERYHHHQRSYKLIEPRVGGGSQWTSLEQARSAAALEAWRVLADLKNAYRKQWSIGTFEREKTYSPSPTLTVPAELNPSESPKQRFWDAVVDPDPSSMLVAQDIALENGWKIWKLGQERPEAIGSYFGHSKRDPNVKSYGSLWYTSPLGHDNGVEWKITAVITSITGRRRPHPNHVIEMFFEYQDMEELEQWQWESNGIYDTVDDAARAAARYAWYALKVMKQGGADGNYRTGAQRIRGVIEDRQPDALPLELNPSMTKNPDDLETARAKYEEFHRYAPKKVGEFPSSFTLPKRLLCAGKAKWVTYRSGKVDPSTLKKPRGAVDYIHEHDAGVMTYIKDGEPDTEVPEKYRDVGALVKLGECLGFCVVGDDGEDVEAEATTPLPELYSTPDGKCLFVIQSKRDVLAATWGGALGVFARGIDG